MARTLHFGTITARHVAGPTALNGRLVARARGARVGSCGLVGARVGAVRGGAARVRVACQ